VLLDVVGKTAFAATAEYGDDWEIWHDYTSIPQWQYPVQQPLLLLLPTIFKQGHETIVHMSDVSEHSLTGVLDVETEREKFEKISEF
jgi:hypothetical protein